MVGREGKGRELGGGERDGGMKKNAGRGENWERVREMVERREKEGLLLSKRLKYKQQHLS